MHKEDPQHFTHLWHSIVAKDSLEHGDAAANDDVVADIFHDGSGFPGNQRQQHRGLVEVPEEEEFPTTGCRAAHVTKEVGAGVPEYTVKAQHHLQEDGIDSSLALTMFSRTTLNADSSLPTGQVKSVYFNHPSHGTSANYLGSLIFKKKNVKRTSEQHQKHLG